MTAYCSTSHPFVVTGTAEQIRDVLCGPQQHDEHCKGWRWHMYCADDKKRMDNVMAEVRKMAEERKARITHQQQADADLAAWQALRELSPQERVRQLWAGAI
jgi:hypothetical protein